jgi:uncharacterized protein DUF5684
VLNFALTLAQYEQDLQDLNDLTPGQQAGLAAFLLIFFAVFAAVVVILIASYWRIFTKAGQPGWAAIVPIYNWIVLLRVIKRPVWMIVLFLVSGGIIGHIIASIDLARAFGKSTGYAVGLILLPFVFYPMLAFGSATYDPSRLEGRGY